jgi:hypothetical protein
MQKKFECDKCSEIFSKKNLLKEHMEIYHKQTRMNRKLSKVNNNNNKNMNISNGKPNNNNKFATYKKGSNNFELVKNESFSIVNYNSTINNFDIYLNEDNSSSNNKDIFNCQNKIEKKNDEEEFTQKNENLLNINNKNNNNCNIELDAKKIDFFFHKFDIAVNNNFNFLLFSRNSYWNLLKETSSFIYDGKNNNL